MKVREVIQELEKLEQQVGNVEVTIDDPWGELLCHEVGRVKLEGNVISIEPCES